jgi:predicted dehydrogenase
MALTAEECDRMMETAGKTGSTLAVGLLRRMYASSQLVKKLLEKGVLGKIRQFEYREGFVYDWNVTSDFMFRKETGGGVLADSGSHVLDLLLWWLGNYKTVEYHDDARGGVGADCEIYLEMQSGAKGIVELSRTRKLRNTCLICGDYGILEVGTSLNSPVRLAINDSDVSLQGQAWSCGRADHSMKELFARQLDDFVEAIRARREPSVSGSEGKKAVELIENCHAAQRCLEFPWDVLKSA